MKNSFFIQYIAIFFINFCSVMAGSAASFEVQVEESSIDFNVTDEENIDFPLDLNSCSDEEINSIPILSISQAKSIIEHRQNFGTIISLYELQTIEDLDKESFTHLKNYFFVEEISSDPRNNSNNLQPKDTTIRTTAKIPNKKQEESLGSSIDFLFCIRRKNLTWDYGISGKKSSFEKFAFDFKTKRFFLNKYRAHLMYSKTSGLLRETILGNYSIGSGEGLILNNGMAMKTPFDCIKISKSTAKIIKPYTSPNSIALFGVATQFSTKYLNISPFASRVILDGNVDGNLKVLNSKSNKSGFTYDSEKKLEKRNSYTENVFGAVIASSNILNNASFGYNILFTNYSVNIFPRKADQYIFSGNNTFAHSLFYNVVWRNVYFFGENGLSKNFSKSTLQKKVWAPGLLNGLIVSITKHFDFAFCHRYYSPYFTSLYGASLRQNQSNINENGYYVSLRYKPYSKIFFDCSQDAAKKIVDSDSDKLLYSFIWKFSATYQPTNDLSVQLSSKIKSSQNLKKETNEPQKKNNYNYKVRVNYTCTKNIKLKSELIFNRCRENENKALRGFGAFQDLSCKFTNLKISARVGYINAESNECKVYTFDPTLKFSWGLNNYKGKGFVAILGCQYKLLENLTFEAVFSMFNKVKVKEDEQKPLNFIFQICYSI